MMRDEIIRRDTEREKGWSLNLSGSGGTGEGS